MRYTPTSSPVCCAKCGQQGGMRGTPPLVKAEGEYVHQGKCPDIPKKRIKLVKPTPEQIIAVQKIKDLRRPANVG